MSDDVASRVRSVLEEVFSLTSSDVTESTSPETVEAWDSLHHLTLVIALEEEFNIHFDDEETVALVNFPLIVATVEEHVGGAESG